MYNLQNVVSDIEEVPASWVYKNYYKRLTQTNINQPFDGRIIKVKSVRNRDSDPSLCFFYKDGKYLWRDFSQGIGGNFIKFVAYHFNKTNGTAVSLITHDYERYIEGDGEIEEENINDSLINKPEFKINFDVYDENSLKFWDMFKIGIETLNRFNVRRSTGYRIKKGNKNYDFGGMIFAFMCKEGPYQLYQPYSTSGKYINIKTDYLIGSEQLEFKSNVCIIQSGLKDIMASTELDLNIEYVAPPSENTMISKDKMEWLKSKYKFLLTMFDNDKEGIKAMIRYKNAYNLPYVHMKLKKDSAENNSNYSIDFLKHCYTEEINKKLNNSYGSSE